MPLDFGIGEALAAFAVSAGVGAETAAVAAPIIVAATEGAALGAGGAALTHQNVGRGALFGGLSAGLLQGGSEALGALSGAGGAAAGIGADTGATFADSLVPATTGVVGGAIDSGAFDATFGGLSASQLGGVSNLTGNFGGAVDPTGSSFQPTAGGGSFSGGGENASFIDTTSSIDPNAASAGAVGQTAPGAVGGNAGFVDTASTFGGGSGALAGDISGATSIADALGGIGTGAPTGAAPDLSGAIPAASAPAPVTPFTLADQGTPTVLGGSNVTSATGAPGTNIASLGGGAGPGATSGAGAFAPPAILEGAPQSIDATSAFQSTPGSVFSGATDTSSTFGGGATPVATDAATTTADAGVPAATGAADAGTGGFVDTTSTFLDGTTPGSGSSKSLLDRIGGGIEKGFNQLTNDPLKLAGLAITGGGLLHSLAAPQQIPGQAQLAGVANTQQQTGQQLIGQGISQGSAPAAGATNLATSAVNQGQQLSSFLTNGTLPPGVQANIDQATNAAIQTIKGQYASRGMSGSSSELQDINQVKARAVSQGAQIALQLTQQGLGFEQLGATLYNSLIGQSNSLLNTGASLTGSAGSTLSTLINQNVAQNNQVNQAIANLGRALSGGTVSNTGTQAA